MSRTHRILHIVKTAEAEEDFNVRHDMLESFKPVLAADKYEMLTAALARRRAQGIYVPLDSQTIQRMVLKAAQGLLGDMATEIGIQFKKQADELTPSIAPAPPAAPVVAKTGKRSYAFDVVLLQLELLEKMDEGVKWPSKRPARTRSPIRRPIPAWITRVCGRSWPGRGANSCRISWPRHFSTPPKAYVSRAGSHSPRSTR